MELILTAAHCIDQFQQSWPQRSLVVKLPERPQESFFVSSWSLHPKYERSLRSGKLDADLALLRLSTPLNIIQIKPELEANLIGEKQLWMQGFSPVRLQAKSLEAALKSKLSWNELKVTRKMMREGKVELKPRSAQPASCPGDSGAPLWVVQNNEFTLHGVIVQGNCERGTSRAVLIEDYTHWVEATANQLIGYQQAQKQLSKIFHFHLSEVFRMGY